MLNRLLVLLLILCFAFSGQFSSICFDNCPETEVSASTHAGDLPFEQDCEGQSNSCCSHLSMISFTFLSGSNEPTEFLLSFPDFKTSHLKSPILDGPFQPPKV